MKHSHFFCGSIEQGLDKESLVRLLHLHQSSVSISIEVLINTCAWLVSFKIVYAYMNLSLMDRSSFKLIIVE
jgi:hypothetical protein